MNKNILNMVFAKSKKKELLRYRKRWIEKNFTEFCIMKEFRLGIPLVGKLIGTSIIRDHHTKEYSLIISIKKWHMLSNTLVDKHNEQQSKETLTLLKNQIKTYGTLMYNEHNYLNPPIGIWDDAEVIDFEGESYLFGSYRKFTVEDIGTEIKIKKLKVVSSRKNEVSFDRNFEMSESVKNLILDLKTLEKDQNIKVYSNIKKSFEFTPELLITMAITNIFTGVFNQIGVDIYNKVKEIYKKFVATMKEEKNNDIHIILEVQKTFPNGKIVTIKTVVILDKNNQDFDRINNSEIDTFINNQLDNIDLNNSPISIIVNSVNKNKEIEFVYSINESGFPHEVKNIELFRKLLKNSKI